MGGPNKSEKSVLHSDARALYFTRRKETTMNAYKITGSDAIRLAERDSLKVYCYANPIDDGGQVSVGVARQIMKEDPSLVYVTVFPRGWWDGRRVSEAPTGYSVSDYFSSSGMYLGPDESGVEPTWDNA